MAVQFAFATIILPASFAISLFEFVGWRSGAVMSARELSSAQAADPRVVAVPQGGIGRYAEFKLSRIEQVQPEVIFIGHSRCGQVRAPVFAPYTMYNACLTAWTIDQIRDMAERVMQVAKPRVIVVTIDYFMFTEPYLAAWTANARMTFGSSVLERQRRLIDEFATHPEGLLVNAIWPDSNKLIEPLEGRSVIGVEARKALAGFRSDGSFLFPSGYHAAGAIKNKDAARDFLLGIHGGPSMERSQVDALRSLAKASKDRGVSLVAVQLPIYAPVVQFLNTSEEYRAYAGVWRDFQSEETHKLFANLDVPYFDMSTAPGSDDAANFVDPAHPNEAGAARAILALLDYPAFRRLFPRISQDRLRDDIQKAAAEARPHSMYPDS